MNLMQQIFIWIVEFVLNYLFIVFLGLVLLAVIGDFYARFLKVDRETDHIDLMARYVKLQMIRRLKHDQSR